MLVRSREVGGLLQTSCRGVSVPARPPPVPGPDYPGRMVSTLAYGSWPSPISAASIAHGGTRLGGPQFVGDQLWWTEGIAAEGGRQAVVRTPGPAEDGGAPVTVLPSPWNARSRVHEYGGGSWAALEGDGWAVGGPTRSRDAADDEDAGARPGPAADAGAADGALPDIVFVHFDDQRAYLLVSGQEPRPLTPAGLEIDSAHGPSLRWACPTPVTLADGTREVWWICEDHTRPGTPEETAPHIERYIAAVPLDGSAAEDVAAIRQVTPSSRFVAHPRISPDGTRLAWISWEHPQMPWDGTVLHLAPLVDGVAGASEQVAGGTDVSVVQPAWLDAERLVFLSDEDGWWTPRVREGDGTVRTVLPEDAAASHEEWASPMWLLGGTSTAVLDPDHLLGVHGTASETLGVLDLTTGALADLDLGLTAISAFDVRADGQIAVAGASPTAFPGILTGRLAPGLGGIDDPSGRADAVSAPVPGRTAKRASARPIGAEEGSSARLAVGAEEGAPTRPDGWHLVRSSRSDAPDPSVLPRPEPITVPLPDGGVVHAIWFAPRHEGIEGLPGEKPPVIARVHGGPTSQVPPVLTLPVAYYTSRGLGVVEVNYGGSSGFGRTYRDRLQGQWGVVDVEDTVAVMEHLVAQGLADPRRLAIEGGSAGGWTTLACLTRTDTFGAGVSSYGVAELEAFIADTHDFESRYIDGLVGPYPARRDLYVERAPLSHVDELSCPVLLLQGDEDRIVPPSQSEMFRDALAAQGIPHAYLLFAGEQHGFRKASSIIEATEAALSFYGQVFGFEPGGVPVLELQRG